MDLSSANQTLVRVYSEAIEKLGREASVNDGWVSFTEPEFGTFMIALNGDTDPAFFQMFFPTFATSKQLSLDELTLHKIVNQINRDLKSAKLLVVVDQEGEPGVAAAIEAFLTASDLLPEPRLVEAVLPRNVRAVQSAVREFVKVWEQYATRSQDTL